MRFGASLLALRWMGTTVSRRKGGPASVFSMLSVLLAWMMTLGGCGGPGASTSGGAAGATTSSTAATGGQGGQGGSPLACLTPSDCPATATPCIANVCVGGVCGLLDVQAGAPLAEQVAGDCSSKQCDGAGAIVEIPDPGDDDDDGNDCTLDSCDGGATTHTVTPHASCSLGAKQGVCTEAGDCAECIDETDCPLPLGPCSSRLCAAGTCGVSPVAAGVAVDSQIAGDCKQIVCDGEGGTLAADDPADPGDDGKECTVDACAAGVSTHSPKPAKTACAQDGGKMCSPGGLCVECVGDDTCASGVCQLFQCVPPSCNDAVKNGDETDLNCGGLVCAKCAAGKVCLVDGDCQDKVCKLGICQAPKCDDLAKNGAETDVDCGGPCAAKCATNEGCGSPSDCQSGVCSNGQCLAPACPDGVKNGTETDTDCGGVGCVSCAVGKACGVAADCQSGVCTGGVCQVPKCNDTVKNGSETDTDCGGGCPLACGTGKGCVVNTDCQSAVCLGSVCQAATCADGVKNGSETDTDCGGACAPCADGKVCLTGTDCQSKVCVGLICKAPTCLDGVQNGAESGADCGGSCVACPLWAKGLGDASTQRGKSVAFDSAGNAIIAGELQGTMNLGGGPLTSAGGTDVFVAKLAADGNHLWSKRFGDGTDQIAESLAIDVSGNVLVTGYFGGTLDLGCGPLTSTGGWDVFLAKLSGMTGTCIWSKRFGATFDQLAHSVAVDSSGNVLLTGEFNGYLNLGGADFGTCGSLGMFVAKYDPAGNHVWSKQVGGCGPIVGGLGAWGRAIAVDSAGNIVTSGYLNGFGNPLATADFGCGPITITSPQDYDVLVAKMTPAGACVWSKHFGDTADQRGYGVGVDGAGNAVVTGYLTGTADFGGGPLASAGAGDLFVAKLDGSGNHLWSKRIGSTGDDRGAGIAVDSSGNVALTGYFNGSVDFGGGALNSAGGQDAFVLKLDPSGSLLWSRRFGGATSNDAGSGIAANAAGQILMTGSFQGTVDFGLGPIVSNGVDLALVKYPP